MVSRVARHTLVTLSGMVAVVVPGIGFPQSPAEGLRADDQRERIAEAISAAQRDGGHESAELIEPLTELGELYESEGEHALAAAALEQARHVVRANYGLHTLDQVFWIERALENQQALGNFVMVRALEEKLFDLAERHPDDLRTVAIRRNIGARRMNLLRHFVSGEFPAEIYGESGLFSISRDLVVSQLVSEAQIHYADAAAVILRNGLDSSDELRDLEMEIVRSSDLFRQRSRPATGSIFVGRETDLHILDANRETYGIGRELHHWWNHSLEALRTRTNTLWDLAGSDGVREERKRRERVDDMITSYQLGRESYRRLIAYEEAVSERSPGDGAAWENRLTAYLQLADWDLLYSENGAALDEYAQVHEMLAATGATAPLIAEIFAPPIPVTLPTFLPNPLQTPVSARYIDVGFEVTRYGQGRRIEILGAAPNVPEATKRELASVIMGSRFRPRVMDGALARAAPVRVRYYLDD
jgi:tetratricopeptide (TPR) repeat protein